MNRLAVTVCSLVVLMAGSALGESTPTNRSKWWPHGLYDKLFRPTPKRTEVSGIRIEPVPRRSVIIYRGTQFVTVSLVATNHVAPLKLPLQAK